MSEICVMWTHTSDLVRQGWSPNHFVLCVLSGVLTKGCSDPESGHKAEPHCKPGESPCSSTVGDEDQKDEKSKIRDSINTSSAKKQKLDNYETEHAEQSVEWHTNKSWPEDIQSDTSTPKRQKLGKDSGGIEHPKQSVR